MHRQQGAWLGLIPRRVGTGGKVTLHRITKSGDRDLRAAIIPGARAVLRRADRHEHVQSQWLLGLKDRRGAQTTIEAFANTTHRNVGSAATRLERLRQTARIAWAVITGDGSFDRTKAFKAQPARSAAAVEAAAEAAPAQVQPQPSTIVPTHFQSPRYRPPTKPDSRDDPHRSTPARGHSCDPGNTPAWGQALRARMPVCAARAGSHPGPAPSRAPPRRRIGVRIRARVTIALNAGTEGLTGGVH